MSWPKDLGRLFGKRDPVELACDVSHLTKFASSPIYIEKERGQILTLRVTKVSQEQVGPDVELHIQFHVREEGKADDLGWSENSHGERQHVSVPMGSTYELEPLFFYTLTTRLSLEQNRENLRDYVLKQRHRVGASRHD